MAKCPNRKDKNYLKLRELFPESTVDYIWEVNRGNLDFTNNSLYKQATNKLTEKQALSVAAQSILPRINKWSNGNLSVAFFDPETNTFERNRSKLIQKPILVKDFKLGMDYSNVAFIRNDGSIIMPNENLSNNKDIVKDYQGKSLDKINTGIIIDHLSSKFNLNFIEESDESINSMFPGTEITGSAFVYGDNIHYNIDRIKSTDFFHELSHLWYKGIEISEPGLFQEINDQAQQLISENHPIVIKARNDLKKLKSNYTEDNLREEITAIISGFASKEAVERFLYKNNIKEISDKNFIEKLWNSIKDIANRINDFFKSNILKSPNNDLNLSNIKVFQIFKNYAEEIMKRNNSVQEDETLSLFQSYISAGINYEYSEIPHYNIKKALLSSGLFTDDMIFKNKDYEAVDNMLSELNDLDTLVMVKEYGDDENGDKLYRLFFINDVIRFSDAEYTVSSDIKQAFHIFNNNASNQKVLEAMNDQQIIDLVYNQMDRKKGYNEGNYVFNNFGKTWKFQDDSVDVIKNKIRDSILPEYHNFEANIKSNIKEFVDKVINTDNANHKKIADLVFGNNKYNEKTISRLLTTLGVKDSFIDIVPYSQLKDHFIPQVAKLYNQSFEGMDPIIVIHGINKDTDTVDLSILDITSKPISRNRFNKKGYNLLSSLNVSDKTYNIHGGTLSNSSADIRKVLLGMTVMNMNKQGNIKVRNIGVYRMTHNNFISKPIIDIDHLLKEIKIISNEPKFMNLVTNDDIRSTLNDKELYDKDYHQSYFTKLKHYLHDLSYHYPYGNVHETQYGILDDPSATYGDYINVVKSRMAYLENKFGENTPDLYHQNEYRLLSYTLKELTDGNPTRSNKISDMNNIARYTATVYDIENPIVQWAIDQVNTGKNIVVDKMMQYIKNIGGDIENAVKEYQQKHFASFGERVFKDIGSKYFERFYKKDKIIAPKDMKYRGEDYKKGDEIEVIIPEIITEYNEQAKKNGLSEQDVRFSKKLATILENRMIDNIYHNNIMKIRHLSPDMDFNYTKEDAKKELLNSPGYKFGVVPVLEKSVNELLSSGKFRDAFNKLGGQLGNYNILFEDELQANSMMNKISTMFDGQHIEDRRFELIGVVRNPINGNLEVQDENQLSNMSTNLEIISNYYMMASIRKDVYEKEVMPYIYSAKAILESFKYMQDVGMDNSIKYLDEYINRTIYRRTEDENYTIDMPVVPMGKLLKTKNDKPGLTIGRSVNATALIRGALKSSSFVTLGLRWSVAMKSMAYNNMNLIINSLSSSLSGAVKSNAALPGIKHVLKAQAEILTPKGFNKSRALAYKFQLMDRSERDILTSPFVTKTRKHIWQEQFAHIGNWATDSWSRMLSMTAIMMKDGSYDAFDYDSKTGDIIYDERKDTRFYDSNKNLKKQNGEHAIKERIRQELIKQGIQDKDKMELELGYDLSNARSTFKWYADKFIIGAMDENSKALFGNTWVGAIFQQYRVFMLSRLNNFFQKQKYSRDGVGYKAIQLDNGEWITKKDLIDIEGVWQSWVSGFNQLMRFKSLGYNNMIEFFNAASPMRRLNIVNSIMKTGSLLLLYAMYALDNDDEKKYKKNKSGNGSLDMTWLVSDLFVTVNMSDMIKDPVPIVGTITDLANVAIGQKDLSVMLNRFGPYATVEDLYEYTLTKEEIEELKREKRRKQREREDEE